MRFGSERENRRAITLLWILCTIGTLFSRICFDNVQADSYLACADFASESGAAWDADFASGSGAARDSDFASGSGAARDSDFAFGSSAVVLADSEHAHVDGGMKESLPSVFTVAPKGVPAQQAYVSEASCQGSSAFVPRKATHRINLRCSFGNASGILSSGAFSDTLLLGRAALSFDGLCEVASNTVILQYIHRQDGEKSIIPLHS